MHMKQQTTTKRPHWATSLPHGTFQGTIGNKVDPSYDVDVYLGDGDQADPDTLRMAMVLRWGADVNEYAVIPVARFCDLVAMRAHDLGHTLLSAALLAAGDCLDKQDSMGSTIASNYGMRNEEDPASVSINRLSLN
mgnify:CR=1 FL=1